MSQRLERVDLPLIDEARELLLGAPTRYGHVIVDEAQDLTPMQLRMICRRAAALHDPRRRRAGDGAGAVRALGRGARRLPGGDRAEIEELKHAYRVPSEIMALALPLLEHIAPDVEPPVAYRAGAEPPRIVRARSGARRRLRGGRRARRAGGLLALIAPPSLRGDRRGPRCSTTRGSPC